MQDIDIYHGEILHLFTFDGTVEEARTLIAEPARFTDALGGEVVPDRVEVIEPRVLADLGLSAYLVEGHGAAAAAVSPDAMRLDRTGGPVILLLPRAAKGPLEARPPLLHLGSYPLEQATPAGAPVRSASAQGETTGPAPDPHKANRRAQGYVALVAILVALLVVLVVWAVSL